MGVTQEFNKQKIIDVIQLATTDTENVLAELYDKLDQTTKEYNSKSFYKKLFSADKLTIESILDQIDHLKHLLRKIKEIQTFLSVSDSTTVALEYSTFRILAPYYQK